MGAETELLWPGAALLLLLGVVASLCVRCSRPGAKRSEKIYEQRNLHENQQSFTVARTYSLAGQAWPGASMDTASDMASARKDKLLQFSPNLEDSASPRYQNFSRGSRHGSDAAYIWSWLRGPGTGTGTGTCSGKGLSGGTHPASPSQRQVTGASGTPERKGPEMSHLTEGQTETQGNTPSPWTITTGGSSGSPRKQMTMMLIPMKTCSSASRSCPSQAMRNLRIIRTRLPSSSGENLRGPWSQSREKHLPPLQEAQMRTTTGSLIT
ncbi:PREDICTED: linker for activation of T-cells family member 2 isoform X1 [Hipposideros armiger]|uniref:Linker for activation of T-cells family member 2 isoform X1 n=1 Tax=Hipposideros armiger TaxID=186990 RepID=A0A8B7RMM3_HIPAR|nr:PREDICTED: linker for activation of T-cells family member 2 isoform X1 [Hipposideros armiger]XP_019502343.1 PREDICTED: linker for activation of T-cells family member 2 isoform X1 [Hipposideros armiger]